MNTLRMVVAMTLLAALTGCAAQGQLSSVPVVENPDAACDVYVIRKSAMFGAAISYVIGIDHNDLLKIASGYYVHVQVDGGSHVATVKYPRQGFLGTAESSLGFECAPNEKVYILVWPGFAVNMKLLSEQEGAKLVSKYKQVVLE